MTDRRDDRDLEPLLTELAETLSELQGEVENEHQRRSPSMRPPSFREVLRFTEQQTIPTLVAILEANVRMLELAGAALRAMDPERSTSNRETAQRALDTGRVSSERLASGLSDLRSALAGAEATNPEARDLLAEADQLSAEIRERLQEADADDAATDTEAEGGVTIDVADAGEVDDEETDQAPEPDIDAELDSIRDEVRGGDADNEENAADEPDENPKE